MKWLREWWREWCMTSEPQQPQWRVVSYSTDPNKPYVGDGSDTYCSRQAAERMANLLTRMSVGRRWRHVVEPIEPTDPIPAFTSVERQVIAVPDASDMRARRRNLMLRAGKTEQEWLALERDLDLLRAERML